MIEPSAPESTPYRMPAEWEPHESTWLSWPHRKSDWPGKFSTIPHVYTEIIRHLSQSELVNLLVAPKSLAEGELSYARWPKPKAWPNVRQWPVETNRSWVRDSGPIFIQDANHKKVALDWHFNAWAKYPDWQQDDTLPAKISEFLSITPQQPMFGDYRVVLEGGSIDVNGSGLLLTTEECLLSEVQQRNPPMSRADYEQVFQKYLGIQQVIWLHRGIVGDDTHGHVDDLARFVASNTVVTIVEQNPSDENYEILQENREILLGVTNLNGGKLDVVELPMPEPVTYRGQRLPASYANFYIANGLVLVPTFNDPADRVALGILAELFPDRKVVGIHCVDLVWGLGTLHCMTQQEPR